MEDEREVGGAEMRERGKRSRGRRGEGREEKGETRRGEERTRLMERRGGGV